MGRANGTMTSGSQLTGSSETVKGVIHVHAAIGKGGSQMCALQKIASQLLAPKMEGDTKWMIAFLPKNLLDLSLAGLCTVPKESGLWNVPGLKERGIFHPFYDDSAFCWHGKHHKDCNKMIHIVPYGCKWWHFFPEAEFPEHLNKFHELTNNTYSFNLTDIWGQKV